MDTRRLTDIVKNGTASCVDVSQFEKSMMDGRKVKIARGSVKLYDNWIASLKYEEGVVMMLWKPTTGRY
jgi:hypothetical protein